MDLKGLISSRIGLCIAICRPVARFYGPAAIVVATIISLMTNLSVLGQSPPSFASQTSDRIKDGGAADDKVSQRWIPIDRRKLGELGRLGELLQSPPTASEDKDSESELEPNASRSQRSLPFDLSKLDLRSLEERLASLSPEQKERLKTLASQLSKNETVKDLSSAFRDLPPALLDQVRESPALREFAQDVLEDADMEDAASESDFLSADDTSNQPWIKFDPANSSLRSEKDTKDSIAKIDDPTGKQGAETDAKRGSKSPLGSDGTASSERSGVPNRYDEFEGSRPGERVGSTRNSEQRLTGGNTRPYYPRSGSAGQRDSNSSRSTKASSATSSANTAKSNSSQKPETALDVFKRRLQEFGLGQTFEKLAKEAVGIEKSREGQIGSDRKLGDVNKDASRSKVGKDNIARKDQTNRSKESELVNRETATANKSNTGTAGQKAVNEPAAAQNQASNVKTSTSMPEQTASLPNSAGASNDQFFSSWRAPTWNDLPSFSLWHLFGVVAVVGLIAGLFLIKQPPEFVKSAAQRRREEGERAKLIEMEIASRQQVVIAFDTVVARQLRSFEDWWTSQRVIKHVADLQMHFSSQLNAAEQVYKQARYSPPDHELSESELATVREAIRECAKSRDTR